MNFRENFKKDMKKCEHHITDLRKQLASRHAAVEKVSGPGGRTCWERVGRLLCGRGGGRGAPASSPVPAKGAGRSRFPVALGSLPQGQWETRWGSLRHTHRAFVGQPPLARVLVHRPFSGPPGANSLLSASLPCQGLGGPTSPGAADPSALGRGAGQGMRTPVGTPEFASCCWQRTHPAPKWAGWCFRPLSIAGKKTSRTRGKRGLLSGKGEGGHITRGAL